MRYLSVKFIIMLISVIGIDAIVAQDSWKDAITQANSISQNTFDDRNFPGLAVAVMHKGELIWSKGFGYADVENAKVVDPEKSKFRIGSISKSFTAVAMAQLYDQGKLDIKAEVQTYVPDFPKKKWPVYVNEVAHHVAGIRHYRGFEFMSNEYYATVDEGLDIFQDDALLFEPGTKYQYSSYGWNLISAVVEGACDCSFLDYMQHEVFDKAELKHTCADDTQKDISNMVQFYVQNGKKNEIAPTVDNSYKWAGGGFLSTAHDVAKLGYAVMSGAVVNASTNTTFWKPYTLKNGKQTNYGLGWATNTDKKDRPWVGHSGGSVGGTSMLLMYPKEELIVVTLVNLSSAKMDQLAFRVANQFLSELEKTED